MTNQALFTSRTDEWGTPQSFFNELDSEFHFTLDPCATAENAKCKKYFTREDNGLLQDWSNDIVFCNPPYGKNIAKWVEKAHCENKNNNTFVVMLLPARTDTKWFHEFIYQKHEIRFVRGRLKFNDGNRYAPFPSMIVIFNNKSKGNT